MASDKIIIEQKKIAYVFITILSKKVPSATISFVKEVS